MSIVHRYREVISGSGGHYSVYRVTDSMSLLREMFPDAEANEMNFCLFSTSGVHGTYQTIEEEEEEPGIGITFVIMHPRLVTLQYGLVEPKSEDDFLFLKKLRQSSKDVVQGIG